MPIGPPQGIPHKNIPLDNATATCNTVNALKHRMDVHGDRRTCTENLENRMRAHHSHGMSFASYDQAS